MGNFWLVSFHSGPKEKLATIDFNIIDHWGNLQHVSSNRCHLVGSVHTSPRSSFQTADTSREVAFIFATLCWRIWPPIIHKGDFKGSNSKPVVSLNILFLASDRSSGSAHRCLVHDAEFHSPLWSDWNDARYARGSKSASWWPSTSCSMSQPRSHRVSITILSLRAHAKIHVASDLGAYWCNGPRYRYVLYAEVALISQPSSAAMRSLYGKYR